MTTEELNALIAQAEGGDVAAMNQLGQIYGGNEFKDFEKAFYWHKKAAELGNVNSMSNLGGWCYLQGNGTEKNIPLADEWLKKCVENGGVWTWAFNELANIYANDAQYKDLNKAFYWYSKSAEAGDALGMSNLGGWCYLWGNGTEKNLKLAVDWLEKAAEKDNMWSVCKLACDIYSQDNEFKDIDKALVCIEKIIVKYFAVAQPDYDRALKCLEKLAEEGNPKAICLMPKMIQDPFGGEHPDKWKWIQKAAEVGDAQCQYKMAEKMLSNNEDEAAYKWFAQSAKGGNVDAISRLNSLGLDFQNGNNGRKQNQPLAYRCYVAAAECGNTDAMANVANCFANGIGVEKHLNKAFEYYKQSAEQGNRLGMSNLGGWCYLWGNGVERDVDKAIYWLAKAADECGDIWSMNKLTYIYGELEGYTNNEQAAKWFLALIQKDCDPNSGVYEKTGYNKDLYEKVKNTILNSASENDMSSLLGSSSGGSLLGGSISFTSSNAKSYINQAEAAVKRKIEYKAEETRRMLEEEERRIAEEVRLERERKEQEEKERREREERERQERERQERERREREERERKEREARELLENLRTKTKIDVDCGNGFKGREWVKNLKGDIVIPDGATRLGNNFFEWCKEITSMTIPNSVTSIGEGTFRDCANLKSIIIPDSVTEIGAYCFSDCKRLTTIVLPNGLTKLEDGIFNNCESLTEIIIPNGVTCICNFAFLGSGLTSIVIPDSVESIGEQAFSCDNLASVSLGKGITEIGGEAFGSPQVLEGDWRKGDWRNGKIKWIPSKLTKISIPLGTRERYEQMEGLQEWFDEDVIVEE